jgi:hypothetical protein
MFCESRILEISISIRYRLIFGGGYDQDLILYLRLRILIIYIIFELYVSIESNAISFTVIIKFLFFTF